MRSRVASRIARQRALDFIEPTSMVTSQSANKDDARGRCYPEVTFRRGHPGQAVQEAIAGPVDSLAISGRNKKISSPAPRHSELPDGRQPGPFPTSDRTPLVLLSETAYELRRNLLQESLNAVSEQVLVLDRSGAIVASNLAWQRFVREQACPPGAKGPAANYTALFDVQLDRCPQASVIKKGLAAVLAGRISSMREPFCWRNGANLRWFDLKVERSQLMPDGYTIVTVEDVTAVRQAEQALHEAAEVLVNLRQQERQRIAQELHDSTVQHVVAAELNLMGLRSRLAVNDEVAEFLDRIESSLDEATKELRSLTYLLHPPSLEGSGLTATLHRYIDGFAKRTGLDISLRVSKGIEELPVGLRRPLFRILQEGMANVHRHASASHVSINVRRILKHLHLIIRDNGRGIGSAACRVWRASEPLSPGVGISGIRERLRQFDGQLSIKSGLQGTMLHAVVPLTAVFVGEDRGRRTASS